ncbi:MAG: PrkA family serine protein kinase [Rhodospirillaceae bacterium]|jgi:serine protein kinase|nr:PrkA family serine protein kinase [Rhodospirillaceae bacterium]MBT5458736.1 PrkA family serine protein kinase [Rhodospirillaceae bacterium]
MSMLAAEVFDLFSEIYDQERREDMSLTDYLMGCGDNPMMFSTAAERMIAAIGEPETIDTSMDPRLGRIYLNRTIKVYPAFEKFYGMEDTIERIVGYFQYAAQGLEERKQILYLLGPVGGGKSSLAERLKQLMEKQPIYVLKAGDEISPIFESPLGLFDPDHMGDLLEEKYGITKRRLNGLISPWATKRLDEFDGDISKFSVVRLQPSKLRQIGIAKTEPGDENNQDISALVGKIDIRKLEHYSQNDPDAYSFSGGLNHTTQGLLEFVEMFKAPIKVLHPLLTATQERNYLGTENLGAFPYQGVVLAHSNEAEWTQFKQNKNNEAFLDRICVVKVPYCLQVTEEAKIYEKLLLESELGEAPCAPEVLEILSRFSVLSRLHEHENSSNYSKMRIYDGETLKDTDPKAKSIQEYRETAGVNEGMTGISTRFAFKVLSATFNHDTEEVAADPVHLIYVIEQAVKREQFPEETENRYLDFIKSELVPRYAEFIGHEIQTTYLESYGEYGQNLFDRYIAYADAWIEEQDYKDPDTGQVFNREILDAELSKIEKPAGIANPKDFRNEVVKFSLRTRANNNGNNPSWTSYNKIREVIEKRMFSQVEELLPVISFGSKKDKKTDKQHAEFVERMIGRGYTERQVRRLVEWYMRVNKAG